VIHQPVQPVSGIVFEKEFFDEMNITSNPDMELSLNTSDENHSGDDGPAHKSAPVADSDAQNNPSTGPRYTFSTDIPETYDDFYLCVLPRDPDMLYVYWELPDGTRSEKHTFQELAPTKEQLVLRVKGQTIDNKETHVSNSYDVPIQMNAADSYVHVPAGAHQCSVECGIVNEWGHFRPYTPPWSNNDQPIESPYLPAREDIQNQVCSGDYGIETAPVSVGPAFSGSAFKSYCHTDTNYDNVPIRTIDLPVVKLDKTHYFGSATPA
jgi:hypothetical protein